MRNLSIFMCLFLLHQFRQIIILQLRKRLQLHSIHTLKQELIKIGTQLLQWKALQELIILCSDGSFHKALAKTSAAQWKASGQSGSLNTYYPRVSSEIADDVVYVRFYYEGIARNGDQSTDYRTRVTQNWIKESGKWVVKTQHYSPAQFGGVHHYGCFRF